LAAEVPYRLPSNSGLAPILVDIGRLNFIRRKRELARAPGLSNIACLTDGRPGHAFSRAAVASA
jgi:hypothetical protein